MSRCAPLLAALVVCVSLCSLGGCAVLASANNQHTGGDGCVGRGFLAFDAVAIGGTGAAVAATGLVEESKAWLALPGAFAASLLLGIIEANGCASSETNSTTYERDRRKPTPAMMESSDKSDAGDTAPSGLRMRSPKVEQDSSTTTDTKPIGLRVPQVDPEAPTVEGGKDCHKRGYSCPTGQVCQQRDAEVTGSICVPRAEEDSK